MTRLTNSVVIVAIMTIAAIALPLRNGRFGRPYTMLNADSSALKSESDDQRSATPPMIPSVAALSWTRWTSVRMLFSEWSGTRG